MASIEESSKKKIRIFSLGPSDGVEDIVAKLEDINEREAPEPVAVSNTKKDTCLIFWSSGTTGLPKGICHSHYSAFNFPGFMSSLLTPNTPAVSTTCFFHVGGFFTGILAIVKRQTYYHVRTWLTQASLFYKRILFRCLARDSPYKLCSIH